MFSQTGFAAFGKKVQLNIPNQPRQAAYLQNVVALQIKAMHNPEKGQADLWITVSVKNLEARMSL